MNLHIITAIILLSCTSILSSKSISFGFESGIIALEDKDINSNNKNKTLNVKVNSFIKIHYIPNIEKVFLDQMIKDNINLKFNLNDYEISMQKISIWIKEADLHFKKLVIDKFQKSTESLKVKDFSDRKIYLKNPFKLVYEINEQFNEIVNFPKEFDNYLYKVVFPKAFSRNIENFSHKFLLYLQSYRTKLNTNDLIEKHDSDCKNAYQCRMALDYSVSKAKVIEFVYVQFNLFLQKEFKANDFYQQEIKMEILNINDKEYSGLYILDDININNTTTSNLKKNELRNFFVFNKLPNYNYYNNKDIWIFQSLDEYIKSNKGKKDDL